MHTSEHTGNLTGPERTWSAVIGAGLTLLVLRRGNPIVRSLAAIGALGLIARAAAGHCAVKAAMTGESSMAQGFRDQWRSMSSQQGSRPSEREVLDAQDYVEERADPAGMQEQTNA